MREKYKEKELKRKLKRELHIRLNDREYKALEKKKNMLNCNNLNDVIRMYIRSGVAYKFNYSAFSECANQIAKIGNNINQIARKVNATDQIAMVEINAMKDYLNEIEDLIIDAMKHESAIEIKIDNDYY